MTSVRQAVLATRSDGKLRELRPLLADLGWEVVDLATAGIALCPDDEERIEAFETFEENALAKARYFHERSGGRPVFADDSGLEVAALEGAPGVRSKRWSGRTELSGAALDAANNALLLERMAGATDRRARFVCAAAWRGGEGEELVVRGEVHGRIVSVGSGSHGFGYDPFFYSDELGKTLADATVEEKQRVSHRGRAFGALFEALRQRGALPPAGRHA